MARKVKFPLKMADGSEVRTLDQLKEHFNIESVVGYFSDGRLLTWLQSRYYDPEAEKVAELDKNDPELHKKLCAIFGVELEVEEIDPEEIARRQERLNLLKQYTYDKEILERVDLVAFDQEELSDLLDEEKPLIYLCNNRFTIPLRETHKTYIGVGKAIAVIRSKEPVDFDALHIEFKNVLFDDDYQKIFDAQNKERELNERKRRDAEDAERPKKLYEEGDAAADAKDYKTAMEKYRQAADLGYPKAIGSVGFLYAYGLGVDKNIEEARRWYKRGMEKEDADSFGGYAILIAHDDMTDDEKREVFEHMKKAVELGGATNFKYRLGQMYRHGEGTRKNLAEAFSCFKAGHKAGDAQCTNMLGVMFSNGEHVEQNHYKAVEFFQKAADNDFPAAIGNLADCYLDGDGVEKNERKGFELYKRAAELGNYNAMNSLGNLYYHGKGTTKNLKEAFKWYEKAADEGNTRAIGNLAYLYRNGEGTRRNISKAIELYEMAAERGDTDALLSLGVIYRDGDGVREDVQKAAEYFQRVADAGNPEGAKLIAEMFQYGEGTTKNGKEAFYWYQQAAENGDAEAMNSLGNMFHFGDGVDVDDDKAFYWYKRSADEGYPWGICHLGWMYRDGKGTSRNISKAIELFTTAGELGLAYGWSQLAFLYYYGDGVEQNYSKAFDLFKRAAEGDDDDAMYQIGYMYYYGEGVSQNYNEAFKCFKKAAEAENSDAMPYLALCYREGNGTVQNPNKAIEWYNKAVEAGNTVALIGLGAMYRYGIGIPKNLTKAIEYYTKAADAGDIDAVVTIGNIYRDENDYYRAAAYFKHAAEQGNGAAMNQLALMYDNGQGVAQDKNLAAQWYRKAADAGDAQGMSNLSLCYLWGEGVSQDMNSAEYWMNQAAEHGNYHATLMYANYIFSKSKFDYRLAKLYESAANAGYGEAAYRLAVLYSRGYGNRNADVADYWRKKYREMDYTPDPRVTEELNNAFSSNSSSSNSSGGGGCFITTAVCDSFGKPDDCFELTTFRKFRDGWLTSQPDGKALIAEYYAIAPRIVDRINRLADSAQIYKSIWREYLEPCLTFIGRGDNQSCKRLYVDMVTSLKERFLKG